MSVRVLVSASDYSLRVKSAGELNARDYLIERVEHAGTKSIELVQHPDDADLILFAESHLTPPRGETPAGVRAARHPLARAHGERCVIHDGSDRPYPVLPGLYPSLPRAWAARVGGLGAPYLVRLNPFLADPSETTPTLLAGFMGSCRHKPVRRRLVHASDQPGWNGIEILDTGKRFVQSIRAGDRDQHNQLKQDFVSQLHNAKFALCPAGAGMSSYRVFEAMQCRRVPVIIADHWLPPEGPEWDRICIRVPESRIAQLPRILREHEPRWREMGELAYEQWLSRYSPETIGPEIIRLAQLALSDKMSRARMRRAMAAIYRAGPARAQALRSLIRRKKSND